MAHFHHHSSGINALILLECAVIITKWGENHESKYVLMNGGIVRILMDGKV